MDKLVEFFSSGGMEAITTILVLALSIVSTIMTKIMKKPESKIVAGAIKMLGAGAFKDETKNWSLPLDPRTE